MLTSLLASALVASACALPPSPGAAAPAHDAATTAAVPDTGAQPAGATPVRRTEPAVAGAASRTLARRAAAPDATSGTEPASSVLVVLAAHLHLGDGRTIDDAALIVRDGVVATVGVAESLQFPAGARVVEHDGHVTPGLVAAYSAGYLPRDEANENTRPFLPDGRVVLGFDPELPRLADALAEGVTTVVLPPAVTQVVGGRTGVVKTAGGRVLSDGAHLALSMSYHAANTDRAPTSYPGVVRALDGLFAEPVGAYAEARSGNLGLMCYTERLHEVDRALRLFQRRGLKGALVGPVLAGELAGPIRESGCSVVLPNPDLVPDRRTSDSLRALAEAEVPFAFWLNEPEAFRSSAIVARRCGASDAQALASITSTAADAARVGTSVGRLARGFDADFVLWSGHPLEFTTRAEAVYVAGELVHAADDHSTNHGDAR